MLTVIWLKLHFAQRWHSIQGSYIDLDDIKNHTPGVLFKGNYDTAASDA